MTTARDLSGWSTPVISSTTPLPSDKLTQVPHSLSSFPAWKTGTIVVAVAVLTSTCPAGAFEIHTEPANALSLPTWAVHTSSVIEWATAMGLMWQYAEVTGNQKWKGMTWGMMPCLGSAMCACTWHFFFNSPDVQFLVALQAALTVIGNFTCWIAAYRIYLDAQVGQS